MKYTTNGGVNHFIEVFENEMGRFLKISVQDTGLGIKDEDKQKLFKLLRFGF